MMENFTAQLLELEQLLKTVRATVAPLAADRRLRQWQQVNFDKHQDLLAEFGFKPGLKRACEQTRTTIIHIIKELDKLDNEYGDLAIDVQRQTIKPQLVPAKIALIKSQSDLLEPPLLDLQEHCLLLFEAEEQARRLPTLGGLLAVTKEQSKSSPEALEQGLKFFLFATREKPDNRTASLADSFASAAALEERLRELEFDQLPPMAGSILEQLRRAGIRAADTIKAYIEDFQQYPPGEIKAMQEFRSQLVEVRNSELSALIEKLPPLTARYANLLLDLASRSQALRQIELIPVFLGKIKLLHDSLQILPAQLREQLKSPGSPLNPERIAAEQAVDFFTGLRGMVLSVKMLFQSLGGSKAVSAAELQQKTVEILNKCHSHAARTEAQKTKIRLFLEDQLAEYAKPFPFELLLDYMKKIITIHGGQLEKAIHGWAVQEQDTTPDQGAQEGGQPATTLARLADKLEIWGERFEVI